MRCSTCNHEVPAGNYCVRCGAALAAGRADLDRRFAAAPQERVLTPRLISSIYPQLPRASLRDFRWALAVGAGLILLLGLLRLFPLALVVAAVLVPFLTVLYLIDVDVYEDEPLPVLALTLLWGLAAGIGMALIAKAIAPLDTGLLTESAGSKLALRGLLIPVASTALILTGPVILLPYRRFNDVLDGTTFGATSAVAFLGAFLIVHSSSIISGGVQPLEKTVPWVIRLGTLGVAVPVLGAAGIGAAMGSLWLRYRAPVRDRHVLGLLGNPAVAVALAAILMTLAALAQLYLATGIDLLAILLLDAIALVWLRRSIQAGLLQEASEIEIGPEIRCSNCGHETAVHSFCADCGISLAALPKGRREAPPPVGSTAVAET